jgi:hypothetical protein
MLITNILTHTLTHYISVEKTNLKLRIAKDHLLIRKTPVKFSTIFSLLLTTIWKILRY